MDTQPFLTADEFAAMIAPRQLTAGERLLVELLVQAAADWIRDPARKPGLARTDPLATQAKLLTFDVVSSVLGAAGVDPRVRQVMTQTDNRTTSITYADAARLLEFDDRHLAMLGLSTNAEPQAFYGTDHTGTYGSAGSFVDAFTDPGPTVVMVLLTSLGPDTVELVIREPVVDGQGVPELDAWGRPRTIERTATKGGASWIVTGGTEEVAGTTIAVLNATGALPVDDDTEALDSTAAVRHRGRLFELTTPGVRHDDGLGRPSHVRVLALWAEDVSLGEQVIVVPAGRRHDGIVEPDGQPITVIARAVTPGSSALGTASLRGRTGALAPAIKADYVVVLDLDAPVRDGDWLLVRGRECRAIVERQESQWTERRELVVLAQYRGGGRT